MTERGRAEEGPGVSIGAAAQLCGTTPETLRNWERRYGFPVPERSDGGHRKYSIKTVERLRQIMAAIEGGARPADAMRMSDEALYEVVTGAASRDEAPWERVGQAFVPERAESSELARAQLDELLSATVAMDGVRLEGLLRRHWYQLGAVGFLEQVAAAFVWEVGEAWFDGRVSVAQEHFASERLRDFLVGQWRPLSDVARGPRVVCATLPGERHVLGLHMAATLIALSGWRITFLGADVPVDEIAKAAGVDASAVLVSVSVASRGEGARAALGALRESLLMRQALVVGGAGAPSAMPGCVILNSFVQLAGWLSDRLRAG